MGSRLLILIMLVSSLAFGVQAPAQQGQPASAESSEKSAPQVAADAPVITLEGPCPSGPSSPESSTKSKGAGSEATATPAPVFAPVPITPTDSGCKIVITRVEFERLLKQPHSESSTAIRNFARHYAEAVLFAEKAHEAGFDQDAGLQAKARFAYLQSLGQIYGMDVREKAKVVSDAEVATYYKAHPEMFEQVDLLRVFVPAIKEYATGSSGSPEVLAADKAQMEAEAQKIYKQALAGASFEKLEERAYKAAGNPEDAPEVQMGKLTRNNIPEAHREMIFSLKVGEISALTPESNGWSIFKVVSKETIPLSAAKQQVQQLRGDDAVAALKSSVKVSLNDAYFGTPEPSTKPPRLR